MKLLHDIENDIAHTIPPVGGTDSAFLFRAMTERSLAGIPRGPHRCVVDLACGLGQDAQAIADREGISGDSGPVGVTGPSTNPVQEREAQSPSKKAALQGAGAGSVVIGLEPSDRMIRFGQYVQRNRTLDPTPGAIGSKSARGTVRFVRGLGEEIPLGSESVDALLCKGALDHFMNPAATMREIARVLRPEGRVVIALANYGSLSCRLGRWFDRKGRASGQTPIQPDGSELTTKSHPYYEPPPDHLTRFDYGSIVALAAPPLRLRHVEGVSLLWGFPPWGSLLAKLPGPLGRILVYLAHGVGRLKPEWADVVILVAEKPRPARTGSP
jgi:SAM-dependent methyltransferase